MRMIPPTLIMRNLTGISRAINITVPRAKRTLVIEIRINAIEKTRNSNKIADHIGCQQNTIPWININPIHRIGDIPKGRDVVSVIV